MERNQTDIDLDTCVETKIICQLVYRTELGKVVTTHGIIRDIFREDHSAGTVAVLENGLPIPIQNILHLSRMEG